MVSRTSPEPEAPVPESISRFVGDIPSAVAVFDAELRYLAANHRWLNAFGIVGEALIGQQHHQVDPPSAPVLIDLHPRALAGETVEGLLADDDEASESAAMQ